MEPCPYDHRETGCLGFRKAERSLLLRRIAFRIVPDYLVKLSKSPVRRGEPRRRNN